MGKFALEFNKHRIPYIVSFFIMLAIGGVVFLLIFLLGNKALTLVGALDAATVSSIVILSISGLFFVASVGFFDSFSYGFKQMFTSMFSKTPNKHHDYQAYRDEKATQRKSAPRYYMSFLFSAVLFIIATIVLFILVRVSGMY